MDCEAPLLVLKGLKKKEDWAIECLYNRTKIPFINYAQYHFQLSDEDIDDIYNSTFAKFWVLIEDLTLTRGDVYGYFFTMLRNEALKVAKKNHKNKINRVNIDQVYDMPTEETFTIDDAESNNFLERYRKCLTKISERSPNAAKVIEYQNADTYDPNDIGFKNDDEIAKELGFKNKDSVKVLRHRWLSRFRNCIKKSKLE